MISTLTSIVIASAVGSSTWTVDDNGPADFSSIHAAIPVIAENDILLVKAGSYPGFTASKSVIDRSCHHEPPASSRSCGPRGSRPAES